MHSVCRTQSVGRGGGRGEGGGGRGGGELNIVRVASWRTSGHLSPLYTGSTSYR